MDQHVSNAVMVLVTNLNVSQPAPQVLIIRQHLLSVMTAFLTAMSVQIATLA